MMEENNVEVVKAFGCKREEFSPTVAWRVTEWLSQEGKCGETGFGDGIVTNNGWCWVEANRLFGKGKVSAVVRRHAEGGGWLVAVATM